MTIRDITDIAVDVHNRFVLSFKAKEVIKKNERDATSIDAEVFPTLSRRGLVVNRDDRSRLITGTPSDMVKHLCDVFTNWRKGEGTLLSATVHKLIDKYAPLLNWNEEEVEKLHNEVRSYKVS